MRNRIGLIAAWTLVTLIGISVTSAAVGSVRSNVTDTVAPRFTVTDETIPLAGADTTTTSAAATAAGDVTSIEVPPSTQDPTAGEAGEDPTDSSVVTSTTTAPQPTTTAAASTTTAPPATSSTTTTAPPVTTTTAAPATVKTYSAVGGSMTVEISGNTVTLLGAVPNSGFSAQEKSRDDTDKVVVEFESETHTSKITVEIEGGAIVVDIDEEPEDDD